MPVITRSPRPTTEELWDELRMISCRESIKDAGWVQVIRNRETDLVGPSGRIAYRFDEHQMVTWDGDVQVDAVDLPLHPVDALDMLHSADRAAA